MYLGQQNNKKYFTIQFTFCISLSSYFALVVCDRALIIIAFLPIKQSFFVNISRISSKPVALCLNQVAFCLYALLRIQTTSFCIRKAKSLILVNPTNLLKCHKP